MAGLIELKGGIWKEVGEPNFGRMHLGYSPGGAQDRFSYGVVLGLLPGATVYELTLAMPVVRVEEDCFAVVGGAPIQGMREWEVVELNAGDEVRLKILGVGCRVYLAVAKAGDVGRRRKKIAEELEWEPRAGWLRIERGAEWWSGLEEELCGRGWAVGAESNGMGVRLSGGELVPPKEVGFDLLSSPVQDGTIQATASGLIALLRDRGTIGGYPRVATVIDVDVDRLAQFRPGNEVRFQLVEPEEGMRLARVQSEAIRQAVG